MEKGKVGFIRECARMVKQVLLYLKSVLTLCYVQDQGYRRLCVCIHLFPNPTSLKALKSHHHQHHILS